MKPTLSGVPTVIQTARGGMECVRTGEGPAVLLLHGAMGGYDQSLLLGRSACGPQGHEFVAVSRPGYLGTPLDLGKAPQDQADLCAALLDAIGIGDVAVIAVSGGGQCALQFALRHAERCRALVMISACCAPLTVRLPLRFHLLKWMARFPALAGMMQRKAAADPDRAAARAIPDPALRARTLHHPEAAPLLRALQTSTMERMAERLPGTLNDIAQSRLPFAYPVERIAAPMLIIHGTVDSAAPFEHAKSLAVRVPGAELMTIEGGEHVSLFTHLDEIRARVRPFLDRADRAAAR